jgi:hypothetical protein
MVFQQLTRENDAFLRNFLRLYINKEQIAGPNIATFERGVVALIFLELNLCGFKPYIVMKKINFTNTKYKFFFS